MSGRSGRGLSAGLHPTYNLHVVVTASVLPGFWRLKLSHPPQGLGEGHQAGHDAFSIVPEAHFVNIFVNCERGGAHVREACSSNSTREGKTSETQSQMKELCGQNHAVSWFCAAQSRLGQRQSAEDPRLFTGLCRPWLGTVPNEGHRDGTDVANEV